MTLVVEESTALRDLITILQEEQEALVASDTEAVAAVTQRKNAALRTVAELGANRAGTMAGMNFSDAADVQAWLKQQPVSVNDSWHSLMEAAYQARELNRVNGSLINRRLAQNQLAIQTLAGGSGGPLYGPNGQATRTTGTRSFTAG